MTQRTDQQPTPCERAAAEIERKLSASISASYGQFNVAGQLKDEAQFRSIMAGYFERKSMRDWCNDFGIDVPEGDRARTEPEK